MFYRHQTLYSTQNQTHTAVLTSHCHGRCRARGRSTCRAAKINGGQSDLKGRGQGGVACLSTACSTVKVTVTRRINTHCHRTCQKWWWKRWTVTVTGTDCMGLDSVVAPAPCTATEQARLRVLDLWTSPHHVTSRTPMWCPRRRVARPSAPDLRHPAGKGGSSDFSVRVGAWHHLRLTPVEAHAVTPARMTTTICFLATFLQA